MARLTPAALGLLTLTLLTGCGGHGQTVIRTGSPVVALALDGDRVAWSDYRSIHLWRRGSDLRLPLPRTVDTSDYTSGGRLVFAGERIGWLFERNDGPLGTFALGVSSASSRTARFLRADRTGYGEKFSAGVPGAVASDGRRLLWTWPQVTLGGPADAVYYCDHYSKQRPCTVRISAASIHGWRRGVIPAAAPIATDRGWLAAGVLKTGTFPQDGSVGPHLVVVRRLSDGAPVAAVRTRGLAGALALSHRLLAVQRLGAIDLYALPSGRFLRTIDVHLLMLDGRFLNPLAVRAGDLIVWGRGRIERIDSSTGERTILVRAPSLTAVAVDGNRLAWATRSGNGSVIRVRSLETPDRALA
jgi:hypothetical protein